MTVRRAGDTIFLEGVCAVEDAETLLQHVQAGATKFDWSGCSDLHAACLQVLMAAQLSPRWTPEIPEIDRWFKLIVRSIEAYSNPLVEAEAEFEFKELI